MPWLVVRGRGDPSAIATSRGFPAELGKFCRKDPAEKLRLDPSDETEHN